MAAIATIVSLLSHGGPVRDVRSQISHCLDVRRGLSRNVRIDLSFEPAPVFVSEPSDAFSFVTTACRNGAPVSLKVRDQTVVAMDVDGRKLFGVEEYEAAAARARTPGWVIAALLIALSALGFFVAVKKPRAAAG